VTRRTPWMAVLPLFGVVACADVWGFSNLTEVDAVAADATTPEEAPVDGLGTGMEAGPDGAQQGDEPSAELPDAQEDRGLSEGGEGGLLIRDGGPGEGGEDGSAAAQCKAICSSGCCDSQGKCRTTTSTAYCGNSGNACETCSTSGCTLSLGACCTSKQTCGCVTALGCM
jgi:hypothetical protein